MKKSVKIGLLVVAVAVFAVAGWYYAMQEETVMVIRAEKGPLTSSFVETGKVVAVETRQIVAGDGNQVVDQVLVLPGSVVESGAALLRFGPGGLDSLLQLQLQQMEQQMAALQAQKRQTQTQRTLSLEQARTQLAAAQWEYDYLFNGEWGVAEALSDETLETLVQARYAWLEVRDGDDGSLDASRSVGALHSQYRQARAAMVATNARYSDHAKEYYASLLDTNKKMVAALEGDASAVAAVDASIAQLELSAQRLQQQLEGGQVTAPFGGTVLEVLVQPGQVVAVGQPLAVLAAETGAADREVELYLLAADAAKLKVGDAVVCSPETGGRIGGTVRYLATSAQPMVSTVGITENRCLVRITLDPAEEPVSLGFGVDVEFTQTVKEDVLSVSLSSVKSDKKGEYIFLFEGDYHGKARKQYVATGQVSGGRVEITQGLKEGDAYISKPGDNMRNGAQVAEA